MTPLTQEWVDKAEGDWNALGRELRARKNPNYDDACFHAQQCGEKYLKARLVEAALPFPKTHDLSRLLTLLLPIEPAWNFLRPATDALTDYGVDFRYPGNTADHDEAKEARRLCALVRRAVRPSLGLPV